MDTIKLTEELAAAFALEAAAFYERFKPSEFGNVNGRSAGNCPPRHIMLRQPPSNKGDIRVTIPASFMQEWKPEAWKGAGLKDKKIQLLVDTQNPGLFALRAMPPETVGKGVYRLEQSVEGGQARFMTTRRYLRREMNEAIEYVPFEIKGEIGMLDLRALKELAASA